MSDSELMEDLTVGEFEEAKREAYEEGVLHGTRALQVLVDSLIAMRQSALAHIRPLLEDVWKHPRVLQDQGLNWYAGHLDAAVALLEGKQVDTPTTERVTLSKHDDAGPRKTRVDFFKPSGKWYATEELEFTSRDELLLTAFAESLNEALWMPEHGRLRYSGMTSVCLDPVHPHAHPLMLVLPESGRFVTKQWMVGRDG